MLILTRRAGESIMIGDDVRVTVLGTNGKVVRLAIVAPRETAVDREEIHEQKKAQAQDTNTG